MFVAKSSCFPQQVVRSSARSRETLKWRAFELVIIQYLNGMYEERTSIIPASSLVVT